MSVVIVKAASTTNISSFPPSGTQTIDGISVATNGDLVLVKDQTTASENGVWQKNSGPWTRAALADAGAELLSVAVVVLEGESQAGTAWQCAIGSISVGTTALSFVQLPYQRPAAVSVRAATLEPISSPPTGLFTLDGVALAKGDLVLVKDQEDGAQNGVYRVLTTAWARATDLTSDLQLASVAIFVREGTKNSETTWRVGRVVPFAVDTDPLPFNQMSTVLRAPLLDAVAATTANITLSGTQTIDGVSVGEDDRVLVKNQTIAARNGLYLCKTGGWQRHHDADGCFDVLGMAVYVRRGATQARTTWSCTTAAPIVVGSTSLTFSNVTNANFPGLERTLSVDGVPIGTRVVVSRELAEPVRGRVINGGPAGGTLFWLSAPGAMVAVFDGEDWRVESSTVRSGVRTLTPYDFGGVGDGVADDTAALEAFFEALSTAQQATNGHLPHGIWRFTSPLRLLGGGDNFHSTILTGDGGWNTNRGSKLLYDGDEIDEAAFHVVGLCWSIFENFIVDANHKAKYAVHFNVESEVDESSSTISMRHVAMINARDVDGAAQCAAGPPSALPSGSTQVDTIFFEKCTFIGCNGVSADLMYQGSGWRSLQANNTKAFYFKECAFYGNRYQIYNITNTHIIADGCQFGGTTSPGLGAEVHDGGGGSQIELRNCHVERGICLYDGVTPGTSCRIVNCQWNGYALDTENPGRGAVVSTFGLLVIENSRFLDMSCDLYNISVNTGTNELAGTRNLDATGTMWADFDFFQVGQYVTIWSSNGAAGLPAPLVPGKYYTIASVSGTGPSRTVQLSDPFAPGVINLTSAGSGVIALASRALVAVNANASFGLSPDLSVSAKQSHFAGVNAFGPFFSGTRGTAHTSAHLLTLNPALVGAIANGSRITMEGCTGGALQYAASISLRNYTAEPVQNVRLGVHTTADDVQYVGLNNQVVETGRVGRTIQRIRITADDLRRAANAVWNSNVAYLTFRLPRRTTVCGGLLEVITAFAGTTTCTVHIYDTDHSAEKFIGTGAFSIMSAQVRGRDVSELGSVFDPTTVGNDGTGHYCNAAQWSTNGVGIGFEFVVSGGTIQDLTAGSLDLCLETQTWSLHI